MCRRKLDEVLLLLSDSFSISDLIMIVNMSHNVITHSYAQVL